jgi:hypothetical protein
MMGEAIQCRKQNYRAGPLLRPDLLSFAIGPITGGASQMVPESTSTKPRRRHAGKAASRQDEQKTKVTLYVPPDLAKRFAVHATYLDMDRSALFAEMIREHCKRFVVSDRQSKAADEATDEVSA